MTIRNWEFGRPPATAPILPPTTFLQMAGFLRALNCAVSTAPKCWLAMPAQPRSARDPQHRRRLFAIGSGRPHASDRRHAWTVPDLARQQSRPAILAEAHTELRGQHRH